VGQGPEPWNKNVPNGTNFVPALIEALDTAVAATPFDRSSGD
jgi:hypothetical protein